MAGEHLERLHRYYAERKLRILVGAGISVPAGFPKWDALNREVLRSSLEKDPPEGCADLGALADSLCEALGRDAAADFVWQTEDPGRGGDFFKLFARALYDGRTVADLPVPPVAHQLAAMASCASIYTTNYDPILELALAKLNDANPPYQNWRRFRGGGSNRDAPQVRHIHGWVDPDGHWGGAFILAESQYIALQSASTAAPNRDLSEILDGEGAVLIVGMSLNDPNLRRLLYQRGLSPFAIAPTYALIKKEDDPHTDRYRQTYWRLRKTTVVSIETHDSLLPVLRDVQFGVPPVGEKPSWLALAAGAVKNHDPFTTPWQAAAFKALCALRDHVTKVGGRPGEVVQLSLFRVMGDAGEIQKVSSTRGHAPLTGTQAADHANHRRLSVRVGQEQGVAGVAFATGLQHESVTRDALNLRFSPDMVHAWETDFESLVAVPIHAVGGTTEERWWLPVGVIVATSSVKTTGERSASRGPCWHENANVLSLLREIGERLLLEKR